ncbi:YrrS family protein, partial [Bacillus sp. B-TM1]
MKFKEGTVDWNEMKKAYGNVRDK